MKQRARYVSVTLCYRALGGYSVFGLAFPTARIASARLRALTAVAVMVRNYKRHRLLCLHVHTGRGLMPVKTVGLLHPVFILSVSKALPRGLKKASKWAVKIVVFNAALGDLFSVDIELHARCGFRDLTLILLYVQAIFALSIRFCFSVRLFFLFIKR